LPDTRRWCRHPANFFNDAVCGEAFNVGIETQNHTVREIAEIVSWTIRAAK
jgi:hypothetical protein